MYCNPTEAEQIDSLASLLSDENCKATTKRLKESGLRTGFSCLFYSLIHPEPEYYQWFCQQVHGLSEKDTDDAPVFPYVWEKTEPLIEGLPLVAHNALADAEACAAVAMMTMNLADLW